MNNSCRRLVLLVSVFFFFQHFLIASNGQNGKMYTVVACVAVILIGIVFFLFYLDRRLKKLEDAEN